MATADSCSSGSDTGSDTSFDGLPEPYRFEPVAPRSNNSQLETVRAREERNPADVSWCICGNCTTTETAENRFCCRERVQIDNKIQEFDQQNQEVPSPECIVDHPGFEAVCLNPYVLETAYHHYKQDYGNVDRELHEKYRYIAYRQIVRWCWGFLGKHNRVPLPSCVMKKIRSNFPKINGQYKNFQWPNL